MTKNDFTITRKPSINIADYLRKHPTWNCVFEIDKAHDGFGWIVHRTPKMIKSVNDIAVRNAISEINPFARTEDLKLFPAKIQKMPPKKGELIALLSGFT